MKEKLSRATTFYKNKKNKSFITLGIYIIFFITVLIVYRPQSSEVKSLTILEKYNTYYKYGYTININNDVYEGINYYNKTKLIHNYQEYYYDRYNGVIDIDKKVLLTLDLTPQKIYDLVRNKSVISKTELYDEGLISKTYKVISNEVVYLDTYDIDANSLLFTTYENTSDIVKVEISFNDINIEINYSFDIYIEENDVVDMGE